MKTIEVGAKRSSILILYLSMRFQNVLFLPSLDIALKRVLLFGQLMGPLLWWLSLIDNRHRDGRLVDGRPP